jgi:hypothetical protein
MSCAKIYRILSLVILLSTINVLSQVSTNNWYVGNTDTGEWIKYKKVWLSAGSYRFTIKAVAKTGGQTVHLEINDQTLQSNIEIPSNVLDTFQLAHLGHTTLSSGYYDLKLVFDTGNVNCDMIFIRKDQSSSNLVLNSDVQFAINRNDGMHTAPIGGAWGASALLAKGGDRGDDPVFSDVNGNPFSREQILSWNKQSAYAYTPEVTDQSMDMYVAEQVASKVDFIFAHGRGEVDSLNAVEDRLYVPGIGNMGCRQLKKLVDAINRSIYAKDNLKIAYFVDNAVFPLACTKYLGINMNWGDPVCQKFLWDYSFKKFFQTVPKEMLFRRLDGTVPIQLWSANANYDYSTQDSKILEFLEYIKQQLESTFGIIPSFILAPNFLTRDPRVTTLCGGLQAWFSWGKNITQMQTYDSKKYAFALNGGRYPITNVWLNDWNPITETGTFSGTNTSDYHTSSLLEDGTPSIRPIYEQGMAENAEWLVMESWSDWREGSTWYRSNHSEYSYPNQYISLVREFADRNCESIVLEAEGCDEYFDASVGNSGGAYRVNWYQNIKQDYWSSNKEIDLDIYRPLHRLSTLQNTGNPGTSFKDFSAGFNDVWGFNTSGKIYCQEIDGSPIKWSTINNQLTTVKKLSLGKNHAWALTTNNAVMRTELPTGWQTQNCTGWVDITSGQPMKDIDLNMSMAWGVDSSGKVYYRNLSASLPWTNVPGYLSSITADDEWIWGFTPQSKIVRMSSESKQKWDTVPNPYNLTKIEAGACEVWGINAKNELYRINSSGDGKWKFVASGFVNVSVGYEYVWLSDSQGNMYKYSIKGFENGTVFGIKDIVYTAVQPCFSKATSVKVSPNPFYDCLHVEISSNINDNVNIMLYDLNGRQEYSQNVTLHSGTNKIEIKNSYTLSNGVYLLVIKSDNLNKKIKIVKMK